MDCKKRLRKVGKRKKKELREKNNKKIEHLIKKQKVREEKSRIWRLENKVGEGRKTEEKELEKTSAFVEEKFDKIEVEKAETCTVGRVELDEDEKAILRMHPKFALRKKLDEEQFELDIECGFAKLRWELGKDENEDNNRKRKGETETEIGVEQ